jgi:hypothetical protein
MVTFTGVGYRDVVLTGLRRILASIQAANGVIIFAWTTALIFYHKQTVLPCLPCPVIPIRGSPPQHSLDRDLMVRSATATQRRRSHKSLQE